jgi:hypothetical protein
MSSSSAVYFAAPSDEQAHVARRVGGSPWSPRRVATARAAMRSPRPTPPARRALAARAAQAMPRDALRPEVVVDDESRRKAAAPGPAASSRRRPARASAARSSRPGPIR